MFVKRYSLILEKNGEMKYVPFKNSEGLTDKATLEQIDYVTSQFKNQEEFLIHLRNIGVLVEAFDKVYIAYNQNRQLMKKDIIYDCPIITFASLSSLRHKKQDDKVSLIDKNPDIMNLIKRIKAYAICPKSYKSMKNSKLFPYYVMEALEDYLNISSKNYKSSTEQFDLKEINDTITYCILKDYGELRKIILWERKYLKKLEDQKEKTPDEYTQMNLVDYFEMKVINPTNIKAKVEIEDEIEVYDESEAIEKNISERSFEPNKGPEDMIENSTLKEFYVKYDGDIELIREILGDDFFDSVSEEDQYRCGYIDYKQRRY